jgi:hypothetical protein
LSHHREKGRNLPARRATSSLRWERRLIAALTPSTETSWIF